MYQLKTKIEKAFSINRRGNKKTIESLYQKSKLAKLLLYCILVDSDYCVFLYDVYVKLKNNFYREKLLVFFVGSRSKCFPIYPICFDRLLYSRVVV